MNQHLAFQLVAGDDWEIQATLLDENGAPYDLAAGPPEIKWTLLDRSWKPALDEFTISVTDAAAGQCSIIIPATATTVLVAGLYTDVIRIVTGGITSTLAFGPVSVTADPWGVASATMRRSSPTTVVSLNRKKAG